MKKRVIAWKTRWRKTRKTGGSSEICGMIRLSLYEERDKTLTKWTMKKELLWCWCIIVTAIMNACMCVRKAIKTILIPIMNQTDASLPFLFIPSFNLLLISATHSFVSYLHIFSWLILIFFCFSCFSYHIDDYITGIKGRVRILQYHEPSCSSHRSLWSSTQTHVFHSDFSIVYSSTGRLRIQTWTRLLLHEHINWK
jgi:hypothetical protein